MSESKEKKSKVFLALNNQRTFTRKGENDQNQLNFQ